MRMQPIHECVLYRKTNIHECLFCQAAVKIQQREKAANASRARIQKDKVSTTNY